MDVLSYTLNSPINSRNHHQPAQLDLSLLDWNHDISIYDLSLRTGAVFSMVVVRFYNLWLIIADTIYALKLRLNALK